MILVYPCTTCSHHATDALVRNAKRESFGRSDAAPKEIAVDATQAGSVSEDARRNPESQ